MKANVLIGVTLAALLGWGAAGDAQAYRWVDEKGQVHYSNLRRFQPEPSKGPEPARPSEPKGVETPETLKGAEPKSSSLPAQARPDQRAPIEEVLEATSTKTQEQLPGVGWILDPVVMFLFLAYVVLGLGGIWFIVVGLKQSVKYLFFSPYYRGSRPKFGVKIVQRRDPDC